MPRLGLSVTAIAFALANLGAHCDGAPRFRPYAQGHACTVPSFKPRCPQGTQLEVNRSARLCEIACRDRARRFHGPYGRYVSYRYGISTVEIGAFDHGQRHGTFRTTNIPRPNTNQPTQLVMIATYRHGVLHGRQAGWTYASGQLSYAYTYRYGRLHGPWMQRLGNQVVRGRYKEGLRDGRFTVTSAAGKPVGSYTFHDGDGELRRFLLDGTVLQRSAMRFGRLHGLYRTYYPDGRVQQLGQYHDNRRDGLWCTYDQRGQTTRALLLRNGSSVHTGRNAHDLERCNELHAQLQPHHRTRPAAASAPTAARDQAGAKASTN